MHQGHTERELADILEQLAHMGFAGHVSQGVERTVVGVVGQTFPELKETLEMWPGVDEVVPISRPHKLSGREFQPKDTVIKVGDVTIGGESVVVIAGPCAVETEDMLLEAARAVKAAGASILRGGAFKPSTSPYSFRGLGMDGLKFLAQASRETGMPIITEVHATLTSSKWGRVICRISPSLMRWARPRSQLCLKEVYQPPFRSGCSQRNISSHKAIAR